MGVKGRRADVTEMTEEPKLKIERDTETHKALCKLGAKWLQRHQRNITVPNCRTVAVDMVTIESETPDVIGWSSGSSVMIEVKVGRGDFLKDYKKVFRQVPKMGVGEFRYYLCPSGLIKESELPDKWGLLYVTEKNKIEIVKAAKYQQSNLKSERNMLLSLIRRQEQ